MDKFRHERRGEGGAFSPSEGFGDVLKKTSYCNICAVSYCHLELLSQKQLLASFSLASNSTFVQKLISSITNFAKDKREKELVSN